MQEETKDIAAEPIAIRQAGSVADGLLAYITAQNASAATRWELGNRLMHDAERDMATRPAFELSLQIREVSNHADSQCKPKSDVIENATRFVFSCPEDKLLTKAAAYVTNHATVMLKIIVGHIVSSVDIGVGSFTYAIVNPVSLATEMGEGLTDDLKAVDNFYSLLKQQSRNA